MHYNIYVNLFILFLFVFSHYKMLDALNDIRILSEFIIHYTSSINN